MNPPTTNAANIYPTWIYLTWSAITADAQTGRDPAIFYDLQWDSGTNQATWTSLYTQSQGLITAYNHTPGVIFPNGKTIYYKLRAKNNVDFGPFSTILSVTCDRTPVYMNPPVITAANINPMWIYITFTPTILTNQTGGDSIIYYGVEWDQGNGTWINLTTPSMGLMPGFN
jgi:hypothetical protein